MLASGIAPRVCPPLVPWGSWRDEPALPSNQSLSPALLHLKPSRGLQVQLHLETAAPEFKLVRKTQAGMGTRVRCLKLAADFLSGTGRASSESPKSCPLIHEKTAGVGAANIWGRARCHPRLLGNPWGGAGCGWGRGGVPVEGGAYLGARVCQPSPAQPRW